MVPESEKDDILMHNVSNSNLRDGIIMTGGSNINRNLGNINGNGSSLDGQLELLLLQQQLQQGQQRNRNLLIQRERDLDIFRSGSAPPTVEGAFSAVGSVFRNPTFGDFTDSGRSGGGDTSGVLTEEDIRLHPAYLAYYYSNENHNPRLPPPLLSKEDWRVAQRVGSSFGGTGDWRNKNVADDAGNSSLFSMQPGLTVDKAGDESRELRNAATSNLLRKSSPDLLDRRMHRTSGASIGLRRKSFADIVQEGLRQPTASAGHVPDPLSRNSLNDNLVRSRISNTNSTELQKKAVVSEVLQPGQMVQGLSSVQNISSSALSSPLTRSRTLDPHLVGRDPSSGLPNANFGVGFGDGMNVSGPNNLSSFSSGVTEIANVAAALAGLNMSNGQYYCNDNRLHSQLQFLDKSKTENMATVANYSNLVRENGVVPPNLNKSSLGLSGQLNFPKRTYSSASLHSQVNHHGFASPGDRNSYNNLCNNHSVTGLALPGALSNGQSMRKNAGPAGSDLHATLTDPRHVQHLHGSRNQKLNAGILPGKASQCKSPMYQSSGIQHRYNGDSSLDHCMSSQGNQMAKSLHPTIGSRADMCRNEQIPRVPSMLKSLIATDSWHSETETNIGGRLVSTLLEELRNSQTRPLELSDVFGHVVEFSKDQNGSRFIQQELETATVEEKMKIFPEIMAHARSLMTDVFGNYVIQKFLKHGLESHRRELASQLIGHVLPLSLQMYGCRVIQKALEVVDGDQQTQMVAELAGSVMKCIRDQNGNHVIQKCIECVPQDRIQFIISSVFGQVVSLSMHPYGCRVIQRVLEHCDDPKTQKVVMDEIMNAICNLAQDQYGNYVIQHVLQHGKRHERSAIISKLAGQIVKMSQQKFASNVVEKCLTFGSQEERQLLVIEILGSTDKNEPLQAMMKDPFGNYVVQKVLETCDEQSCEYILSRIKVHLSALKKYTYGKHIVSRVEKLIATGERNR